MHSELPLKRSLSNSYRPKCLPTWRNQSTRRILKMVHMNRLCRTLKRVRTKWLKVPDELQMNTVTQKVTQKNSEKSKPTCHHCKKPGHYPKQCRQLKREKDQDRSNTNSADNNNNINGGSQSNSNCNDRVSNKTNANNTNIQKDRRPRPVYSPCETCGKTNHSTEKCYFGANAENRPPSRNRRPEGQNHVQQKCPEQLRRNCWSCSPNFKLETPRLYSGAACDRPETPEIPKLPPIPDVVWQQPSETSTNQCNLNNTNNHSTI